MPSFLEWVQIRESDNPLLRMAQGSNDWVYFGIHDIGRAYRETGALPVLDLNQIKAKCGQISETDPITQTTTITLPSNLHQMGYRKMSQGVKTKNGTSTINLPTESLINISHLMNVPGANVWLAVDSNTGFQKEIIRRIRAKEAQRMQADLNQQSPELDYEEPVKVPFQDNPTVVPMDKFHRSFLHMSQESAEPLITSNRRYWKSYGEDKYFHKVPYDKIYGN